MSQLKALSKLENIYLSFIHLPIFQAIDIEGRVIYLDLQLDLQLEHYSLSCTIGSYQIQSKHLFYLLYLTVYAYFRFNKSARKQELLKEKSSGFNLIDHIFLHICQLLSTADHHQIIIKTTCTFLIPIHFFTLSYQAQSFKFKRSRLLFVPIYNWSLES